MPASLERFRGASIAMWIALALSCGSEPGTLVVDLRTDLLPGYDFRTVRVEATLVSELGNAAPTVYEAERFVADREQVETGIQVGELTDLPRGLYHVEVLLLTDLRTESARAVRRIEVASNHVVTVVITLSCASVDCPEDTDTPQTCFGGRCVDACCVPGSTCSSESCPEPLCATAGDCPRFADCAAPSCDEGVCLYVPDHEVCVEPERCHVELGCVRVGAAPDAGPPDAGPPDAGPECVPAAETCNGLDDDCDVMVDETFDLMSDVNHCGACGVSCGDPAGGAAVCVGGVCELRCDSSHDDCDGMYSTGCETDLDDAASCGDCTTVCPGGVPFCMDGTCQSICALTTCGTSCVDTTSNAAHCGGCGVSCALPNASAICTASTCRVSSCNAGYGDCDGSDASGCETDTTSDGAHCGGCGASCGPMASCASSACMCDARALDCSAGAAGCETSFSTSDCGACGVACGPNESCDAAGRCRCGSRRSAVGGGVVCTAAAEECCSGACRDYQTAFNHCGSCGSACRTRHPDTPYGRRVDNCTGGDCFCGADPPCNANQACCVGFGASEVHCRAARTDENHCGACRTQCGTNETCIDGRCCCGTSCGAVGGGAQCPSTNACNGTTCT